MADEHEPKPVRGKHDQHAHYVKPLNTGAADNYIFKTLDKENQRILGEEHQEAATRAQHNLNDRLEQMEKKGLKLREKIGNPKLAHALVESFVMDSMKDLYGERGETLVRDYEDLVRKATTDEEKESVLLTFGEDYLGLHARDINIVKGTMTKTKHWRGTFTKKLFNHVYHGGVLEHMNDKSWENIFKGVDRNEKGNYYLGLLDKIYDGKYEARGEDEHRLNSFLSDDEEKGVVYHIASKQEFEDETLENLGLRKNKKYHR